MNLIVIREISVLSNETGVIVSFFGDSGVEGDLVRKIIQLGIAHSGMAFYSVLMGIDLVLREKREEEVKDLPLLPSPTLIRRIEL